MITVRPAAERGHFDHGWLDTSHTFSFADYHDPRHMGFRALRVINEDVVQPGRGFGTHPHADMEIVTYIVEGALQHEDSMGTGSVIRPGEVQRMSAGTGITHSEFNASQTEPVHLLQIWVLPAERGLRPEYEQKAFPDHERLGRLRLIASPDGASGSVTIHQDVWIYDSTLPVGAHVQHGLHDGRYGWLQVVRGSVLVNGDTVLSAGDGASFSNEEVVDLVGEPSPDDRAEVLFFDLA